MPKNTLTIMEPSTEEAITVKIGAFPGGKIGSHMLPAHSTVRDGLRHAQLQLPTDNSLDVRVNGVPVSSLDAIMADGDQILVFSKIRGN